MSQKRPAEAAADGTEKKGKMLSAEEAKAYAASSLQHLQAKRAEVASLPVGRPQATPTAQAPPLQPCPKIPSSEEAEGLGAWPLMRKVIPWVKDALPPILKKIDPSMPCDENLSRLAPLEIDNKSDVKSFKEAWSCQHCKMSVATTSMYEAGASLYWLDPHLCSDNVLTVEEPSLLEVLDAEDVVCSNGNGERLFFADCFACYAPPYVLESEDLPSKLSLLHRHTLVFAWYVAMAKALNMNDSERIKRLHEMALTITVRVHATVDPVAVALESMSVNDKTKKGNGGDTFVNFARKLKMLEGHLEKSQADFLDYLTRSNCRFNGLKINKSMLTTAIKLASMLTPAISSSLLQIQRTYGREVWSDSYSKLGRLCGLATKHASTNSAMAAEDLLHLSFQACYVAMARGHCDPSFFTQENIDPRGEAVGWARGTFTKLIVVQQLMNLAEAAFQRAPVGKAKDAARLLRDALMKIKTPLGYHQAVPKDGSAEVAPDPNELLDQDPVTILTHGMEPAAQRIVEFVRDLWEGDYETDLTEIALEANPCDVLLKSDCSINLAKTYRTCAAAPASINGRFEG